MPGTSHAPTSRRSHPRAAVLLAAALVAVVGSAFGPWTAVSGAASRAVDIASRVGIAEVTQTWSIAVADYDLDHQPDFLLGRHQRAARLYDGDGASFSEVQAGTFAAADRHDCTWGDVQGDALPDLFCTIGAHRGRGTKSNELWMQRPDHTFVDRAAAMGVEDKYGRGREATFIDYDHDAYPDLFMGNDYPRADGRRSVNRFFVNADGTGFVRLHVPGMTAEIGAGCALAADVTGDGWEDLVVCGKDGLHLYRNAHGHGFTDVSRRWHLSGTPRHAAVADVDGDGRLDIAKAGEHGIVLQFGGRRRFLRSQVVLRARAVVRVAAGDLDGDGDVDLYALGGCVGDLINRPDRVLLNARGRSWFGIRPPASGDGCGDDAAIIDYDDDGSDEVIVTNGNGYKQRPRPGPVQLIDVVR